MNFPNSIARHVLPSTSLLLSFLRFTEPTQGDGSLGVVHFVATMEGSDSKSLEPSSFDRTANVVLLLHCSDPVVASSTDVNRRHKKVRGWPHSRVSLAEPVFVGTCPINSDHATAVSSE